MNSYLFLYITDTIYMIPVTVSSMVTISTCPSTLLITLYKLRLCIFIISNENQQTSCLLDN